MCCSELFIVAVDDVTRLLSFQKISFLNTVGLITHAHAQEAELNQCERRARVLSALEPSSIPSSPKHAESISEELVPMLAPGHSLPPVITTPEELCLAHEYPHKARFLHHLGLQPQHSLHRQQGKAFHRVSMGWEGKGAEC